MPNQMSRRRLLRVGGGVAAAAAVGGGASLAATAAGSHVPMAVPDSPRFTLIADAKGLFREKKLRHPRVLQSFGFDHINGRVYTIQLMKGYPACTGNLTVTKLSLDGTEILGRMYLVNFGHGSQIGVEPVGRGKAPYLWVEYQPNVRNGKAWGTKLCRLRFTNDSRQVDWRDADDVARVDLRDRTPRLPGLGSPRPAIDPAYDRLVVRFGRDGDLRAVVYSMDDARANRLDSEHRIAERGSLYSPDPKVSPPQGFTLYGRYMYLLHGRSDGPTMITREDLNSHDRAQAETKAFHDLEPIREPEGMAIQLLPNGQGYRPRLCFGFASGPAGARRASIAYKDELK